MWLVKEGDKGGHTAQSGSKELGRSECGPPGEQLSNLTMVDTVMSWYSFHDKYSEK